MNKLIDKYFKKKITMGKAIISCLCVLFVVGCATKVDPYREIKISQGKAEGSQDIYKMIEGKMQQADAYDWADQPYIPIRTAEKIHPFLQWDHVYDKDRDIYVGKNLVWVVIEPTKWYIETRVPAHTMEQSVVPYQKQMDK